MMMNNYEKKMEGRKELKQGQSLAYRGALSKAFRVRFRVQSFQGRHRSQRLLL